MLLGASQKKRQTSLFKPKSYLTGKSANDVQVTYDRSSNDNTGIKYKIYSINANCRQL